MKTETYGNKRYFIQVFYYDSEKRFRSHTEDSLSAECALEWIKFYKSHLGKTLHSCHGWEGVIDDVFIYEGHMCRIMSDDGTETLAD